jgi:glucokinase
MDCVPKFFIGIDLGATNAKAGVIDEQGILVASFSIPLSDHSEVASQSHSPEAVISSIVTCVHSAVSDSGVSWEQVVAVGVGSPGHVFNGMVKAASNFPDWCDVNISNLLEEKLERPITVVNDADAALLAECWVGSGKHSQNVVMITLGSGVGASAWCNGSLLVGARGLLEAGHSIIDSGPQARVCGCGQRGCIEAYVSANSVRKIFEEGSSLESSASAKTTAEIFEMASSDRTESEAQLARTIVDEAARLLAVFCINMCRFYDPEIILIGGGMAEAGDALFVPVRDHFQRSRWTVLPDIVEIRPASLRKHAGLVGAAAAAKQHMMRSSQN